jgi:hypothetical protein
MPGGRSIVIAFGESQNLEWELAEIRQRGMSQKLCVRTPPLTLRKNEFGALRKSIDEARASRTTLASTWTAATDILRRAGYECDLMCPGFGAAVMFDEGGKSFVCRGEAEIAAMSGLHRSFERHRLLGTLWAIASLLITRVLVAVFSFTVTWLVILVWAVVFSAPWLISTAVGKMTKGRSAVRQ